MTATDKQERIRHHGIESLQDAHCKLVNIFIESDCTTKNWVDMAPLPAKITWAELQEVSKLLADGLADLLHCNEPYWMRGWAYLDGMATKQLMDMMNEEKQTGPDLQSLNGFTQGAQCPGEDS